MLSWGIPRLRDLPWRHTRDPWHVLVSEVMLQQTRVERVLPKWATFIEAFPSAAACADAPLADVLRLWQGLGYPRRARNLHSASVAIVGEHGGSVPDDLDALLALPGVGPYTARAVQVFAFERDVGVVDTNIARVLARVTGTRLRPREAQALADDLVPLGEGWAWNQVLMDLGAALCRPQPVCDECALVDECAWAAAGHPDPDPAVGSAGVSASQPRFEGSDRQKRGEVLRRLMDGPCPSADFRDDIVDGLVADGLVAREGQLLTLPG